MKSILFIFAVAISLQVNAQTKSRFSAEINYGVQSNYFVRSDNEIGRPDGTAFLNKNFIGSIGGIELRYQATKMATWSLGYAQSSNKRSINYSTVINGIRLSINDFDMKIVFINSFIKEIFQRKILI